MTARKKANKKKVGAVPDLPGRVILVLMRNVENELENEQMKKSRRRKNE